MITKKYLIWLILAAAVLGGALAGCEMEDTADHLFVGTWSGHISGVGRDNMLAIAASGVWDSSFRMEIDEITIGPRMRLESGVRARPLSGSATVYHTTVGSNFEGFKGGAAILEPETVSAALEGFIETSVQSSTMGEEAWRMELDLANFERGGIIELYGEEDTYTIPIERSMIYVAVSSYGILGTNLIIEFSEDGNTMYLRERLSDGAGITGYELTGELHRVTPRNHTLKKEPGSIEDIITDYSTRLHVDIPDVGNMSAGPGAEARVSRSEEELLIEQFRGEIRHAIKRAEERGVNIYEVVLPQAVAAVRGTSFSTAVRDGVETIVVLEGEVEVSDRTGAAPPVIVGENQMLVISKGSFPSGPMDLHPGYPRWWEEVQFTPVEDPQAGMSPLARFFRSILAALGIMDPPDRAPAAGTDPADEYIYIDFDPLYDRDFQHGQYMKLDWWQLVRGEESTGWLTLEVSAAGDRFEVNYAGALGDHQFSSTESFEKGYSARFTFYQHFTQNQSYILHNIMRETLMNGLDDYFGFLEVVGERSSMMGYQSEARGFDTYAGVEGLTFTFKAGTELKYELCLAPEVPVNLYVYQAFEKDEQYRVKLVEYRE